MIKKIANNIVLVKNFGYLSIFQILNMLLPLISYPYLIRILGKEGYGLIVFSQAIIAYFALIVNFGFNISATKHISFNRNNREKLSEIVSSVMIIKFALLLLSFILLSVLLYFIPFANSNKILFFLCGWLCVYNFLFPIWYFQGIEEMKYIAIFTFISKFLFFILIFLFINAPDDYLLLPMINGIGAIIAGVCSLYIVLCKHKIVFKFQPISVLKIYFFDALPLFYSNISLNIYLSANKVIIGSFLGMQEVAFYDLGEKILNIIKMPISLISQTIFPRMSRKFEEDFLMKIMMLTFIGILIMTVFIEFFIEDIILIFAGNDMLPSSIVVRIMIISVLPLTLSNFLGVQTLLSHNLNKEFSQVIFYSLLVYLIFIAICFYTGLFNIYTISFSVILVELYMLTHFYIIVKKKKLLLCC